MYVDATRAAKTAANASKNGPATAGRPKPEANDWDGAIRNGPPAAPIVLAQTTVLIARARRASGSTSAAAYRDSRLAAFPTPSRDMPTNSSAIGAPTAATTVNAAPATPTPYPVLRA